MSVLLDIMYNNTEYTVRRIQGYFKNANQKIEEKQGKFVVSRIDDSGNVQYVPEYQKDYIVKQFCQKICRIFSSLTERKLKKCPRKYRVEKARFPKCCI